MKLWGRLACAAMCLLGLRVAKPDVAASLDPIPVCQAMAALKDYDGRPVALLGRYSFREAGRQKGRWLDQEACDGASERALVHLELEITGPKPPDQVTIDERTLDAKLAVIRQRTALGKFRFGSADYDRWAVVIGRLEHPDGRDLQLVYRGDGAVFFLADK